MMHPSTCIKLCCFYTTCVCKKNEYFFFFDLIMRGCTDQVLDITVLAFCTNIFFLCNLKEKFF